MLQNPYQIRTTYHNGTERILVTGGAGFIGSHLVELLLNTRPYADVTILDNLTYAANQMILQYFQSTGRVRFIKGDISDERAVERAMAGCSTIFHLAAETHVPNSFSNPALFFQTNVMGTKKVLKAAIVSKVNRFVHVSTDEVYGATRQFVDEEYGFHPTSPYASSKVEAEKAVLQARSEGLDALIVRPTNAIGLRQHKEKLLPRFIRMTLEGKSLTIEGTGRQERCFIPVSDLVNAILIVATKSNPMKTYNIPGREMYTVLDVADLVKRVTAQDTGLRFVEDRKVNDFRYRISGNKIAKLGFKQKSNMRREIDGIVLDVMCQHVPVHEFSGIHEKLKMSYGA